MARVPSLSKPSPKRRCSRDDGGRPGGGQRVVNKLRNYVNGHGNKTIICHLFWRGKCVLLFLFILYAQQQNKLCQREARHARHGRREFGRVFPFQFSGGFLLSDATARGEKGRLKKGRIIIITTISIIPQHAQVAKSHVWLGCLALSRMVKS